MKRQYLDAKSSSKLDIILKYDKINAYNARWKILLLLHKNIISVHEAVEYFQIKTNQDEHFLFTNNIVDNLIILSCKSN